MTMRRLAGLAAPAFLALAIAACGGGTASGVPTGSSGPTTGRTEAPSSTAPETGAPETAAPSASTGALPSLDLEGLLAGLDGIDSYKVTISANGAEAYTSTVVTKPELAREIVAGGQRIIVIGEEAWLDTGDGFQPVPASMAAGLFGMYDPAILIGAFAGPGVLSGAEELGTEEKNGVQARHVRIAADSAIGGLASMAPGSAIDIWIAEAGYLVSMAVTGMAQGDFTMDVTAVNDPANVVERPS